MSTQHTEEGGGSGSALLSLPVRLGAPLWSRRVRWTTAGFHCTYAQRPHTGSEWPCSVASSTWSLKAAQLTCVVCTAVWGALQNGMDAQLADIPPHNNKAAQVIKSSYPGWIHTLLLIGWIFSNMQTSFTHNEDPYSTQTKCADVLTNQFQQEPTMS